MNPIPENKKNIAETNIRYLLKGMYFQNLLWGKMLFFNNLIL